MCVTATNGNRMLLDVGEGTVGQLLRRAGVATATTHSAALEAVENAGGSDRSFSLAATMAEYLTSIRAGWIPHSHADHRLGLLRLLKGRRPRDENDPVLVITPACIYQLLEKCEEIGLLGDSAMTKSAGGSQPARAPRYRAVNCWDLVTPPGGKPSREEKMFAGTSSAPSAGPASRLHRWIIAQTLLLWCWTAPRSGDSCTAAIIGRRGTGSIGVADGPAHSRGNLRRRDGRRGQDNEALHRRRGAEYC